MEVTMENLLSTLISVFPEENCSVVEHEMDVYGETVPAVVPTMKLGLFNYGWPMPTHRMVDGKLTPATYDPDAVIDDFRGWLVSMSEAGAEALVILAVGQEGLPEN